MDIHTFWSFPTEDLIMFAESVRYLIFRAGGMANKSMIEDVLMDRFEIDRENARTLTNMAEKAHKRLFTINPTIWISYRWPEPQLEDWPYLKNYHPSGSVISIIRGRSFRLWRQFERIQLTYRDGQLDPAIAEEIAVSYWFLVPMNQAFTATQMAHAMRKYSSHNRVIELAQILENA